MKCIICDTDNTRKDRIANNNCCKTCDHPFVFDPITMTRVRVTDLQFKKAIEVVSSNGTLFFTLTQFAYVLSRRMPSSFKPKLFRSTRTSVQNYDIGTGLYYDTETDLSSALKAQYLRILGIAILFVGTLISVALVKSFLLFSVVVCMGIGTIYLSYLQLSQHKNSQDSLVESDNIPPPPRLFNNINHILFTRSTMQDFLEHWQVVNQKIPKLLSSPSQQLANVVINPDVSAYSFDRLVVCDRSEIAQLLIANNFHFENNCAVLSITGYPESIFDTTMQMLHRNPDLKVYVVHDCSPKGMGLLHQLKSSDRWFKDRNVWMIDIGLMPRQVVSIRGLLIQGSAISATGAAEADQLQWEEITSDEIKWLEAGNYVELESFTPQQLIQMINRGIAGSRDLSYDDGYSGGGGFISTSDSFG